MDEKMMKAGGAAKRAELVKAFGELSITSTKTREFSKFEKQINERGDAGQGERLARRK